MVCNRLLRSIGSMLLCWCACMEPSCAKLVLRFCVLPGPALVPERLASNMHTNKTDHLGARPADLRLISQPILIFTCLGEVTQVHFNKSLDVVVGKRNYRISRSKVVMNISYLNRINMVKEGLDYKYYLFNILSNEIYEISGSLDKLREMMWKENCTIAPLGFVQAVKKVAHLKKKELFTGYAQNDLPEFLIFLIDCFHNSLMREVEMTINGKQSNEQDKMAFECYKMMKNMYKKEYSEMLNIFYGIHVSNISSVKNGKILAMRPEPFSTISLPIPKKRETSIYECMDLYCEKERMEGDNAWYNEKTKEKEDIDKGIRFWSLPNILIIDLKRFDMRGRKLRQQVQCPLENIDFSKYVDGYNSSSYIYDMYAICNHSGGLMGGHYTAFIKNANSKWYLFNDTSVKEVNKEKLITPNAYCFFFRKRQLV